jgi:hypothetical protein
MLFQFLLDILYTFEVLPLFYILVDFPNFSDIMEKLENKVKYFIGSSVKALDEENNLDECGFENNLGSKFVKSKFDFCIVYGSGSIKHFYYMINLASVVAHKATLLAGNTVAISSERDWKNLITYNVDDALEIFSKLVNYKISDLKTKNIISEKLAEFSVKEKSDFENLVVNYIKKGNYEVCLNLE